jgi:hypothetical protein
MLAKIENVTPTSPELVSTFAAAAPAGAAPGGQAAAPGHLHETAAPGKSGESHGKNGAPKARRP